MTGSNSTVQMKLQQGVALHQQGRLAEAEGIYLQILQQQPNHFDALHFLGLIAIQTSRTARGVELIRKAIGLKGNAPVAHCNLANALSDLQRYQEALASYDAAIALKSDYVEAYINRGNALKSLGRLDDSIASYNKAIALKPDYAVAYSNRGLAIQWNMKACRGCACQL